MNLNVGIARYNSMIAAWYYASIYILGVWWGINRPLHYYGANTEYKTSQPLRALETLGYSKSRKLREMTIVVLGGCTDSALVGKLNIPGYNTTTECELR
jgi:hypothetical protein